MCHKLTWNSRSSCLVLQHATITSICHPVWPLIAEVSRKEKLFIKETHSYRGNESNNHWALSCIGLSKSVAEKLGALEVKLLRAGDELWRACVWLC